ncbi:glycosyltransferase [Nocardioides islandensis]|uniref:Glycosyltransferase n=1 Tax=Nocardioides islandensis TaxID=433663 RepID=A0A930VF43_9ACTN|nr:glycosyltransferase [Nocardioides islandensis]MBF4765393.1 glycosyltransferase [Nocardioides islandensis]
MEPTRVDLVMVTNRASPYLAQALESVRAQTYPHWSLVVVDDGTPDPDAVPRAVAGMPRTTVVRQENRGPSAARNRGIAQGDAPLVALLDDDDVWDADKLAEQVRALAEHVDAVASFTAGRYIDAEGREFGSWDATTVDSRLFVNGEEPQPRIVTLVLRREAHTAIGGFDESYRMAEDNEYILRLALSGPLVAVPRPLVSYRRHSANLSSSGSLEGRRSTVRFVREQRAAHRDDPEVTALLDERARRVARDCAQECVRGLADAARRRDGRRLLTELGWAARSPGPTALALVRAVIGRR